MEDNEILEEQIDVIQKQEKIIKPKRVKKPKMKTKMCNVELITDNKIIINFEGKMISFPYNGKDVKTIEVEYENEIGSKDFKCKLK